MNIKIILAALALVIFIAWVGTIVSEEDKKDKSNNQETLED